MATAPVRKALTTTELVVVLASLTLLGSLALPGLRVMRQRHARTTCLSNLRQIAAASLLYASEDDRGQLVGIHKMSVNSMHGTGWPPSCNKTWRTALPFAYGGRTAVTELIWGSQLINELKRHERWGAPTRPLNTYLYGELSEDDYYDLPIFHCPADVGYPQANPYDWGGPEYMDWPVGSAEIPCYDFLGNSYRANFTGIVWPKGGGGANRSAARFAATFESGPRGHSALAIESPASTVLYTEPLFCAWSRVDPDEMPNPPALIFPGWHGEVTADHVAYCDGSVRLTQAYPLTDFDEAKLQEMGYMLDYEYYRYFIRRGPTWREDCHPTPGALTLVFNPNGTPQFDPEDLDLPGWPFEGFTTNECPF